jgi:hypothetical protein
MSILIVDLESFGKLNPMSIISLTCKNFLFLAVSIFRHWTHGGGLLVIPRQFWRVWMSFDEF